METNKQYYIGVRFDEEDEHPIICNGGKIFDNYDACRHDTVDNGKVMKLLQMSNYSNKFTVLENMTNQEKAKEIAKNAKDYFYHDEYECGLACALRMAKWKDEQFEDTKDEIKVDAKKGLAWEIHEKIANGATLAELDNYVCDICDF